MNAFLTETLFPTVLNMSLTASAVILVVLLARFLLRRAPKVFSYALWAVVLFRLLCPVSLTAGISLFGAVDAPVRAATPGISTVEYLPAVRENLTTGAEETPATPAVPVMPVTDPEPVTPAVQPSQDETAPAAKSALPSLSEVAAWVWLTGVVGMLGYSLVSLCRLRRRIVGAVRLRDNIYLADHIDSPFVMGVLRPRIYLPSTLAEGERGYIILHEQCHIQRFDPAVKLLSFTALCLHWFNPLVWLSFLLSGRDMEMRCDEAVIRQLGDGVRADYSASLLSLATGRRILAGAPLAFGEGDPKSRIENLLRFRRPKTWALLLAGVLCVALIAACGVNPRSVADPLGKDFSLGEMLYSDPELGADWEGLPRVLVGENGTVTLRRDGSDVLYTEQADQNLSQDSFDARFRSEESGSFGWVDGMSAAKLRRSCASVWAFQAEDTADGQPNLLWLLAGKNGEVYLALGYQEEASGMDFFAWVFRLTEDQSGSYASMEEYALSRVNEAKAGEITYDVYDENTAQGADAAYHSVTDTLKDVQVESLTLRGSLAGRDPEGTLEIWTLALAYQPTNEAGDRIVTAGGQSLTEDGWYCDESSELLIVRHRESDGRYVILQKESGIDPYLEFLGDYAGPEEALEDWYITTNALLEPLTLEDWGAELGLGQGNFPVRRYDDAFGADGFYCYIPESGWAKTSTEADLGSHGHWEWSSSYGSGSVFTIDRFTGPVEDQFTVAAKQGFVTTMGTGAIWQREGDGLRERYYFYSGKDESCSWRIWLRWQPDSLERSGNPNVAIEPQVMERMAESFRLAGEAPALVTQSVQAEKVADLAAFLADFSRQHGLGSVTVTGVSDEQGMAYLQQLKAAGYQGALPESIQQGGSYRLGMDQTRLQIRYAGTTLSVEMTLLGETRRVMTDEELAQLNEWLCGCRAEANNVAHATPVNGFFLSSYQNVRDLDFVDFLAYFPGEVGEITETEFQALKALDNWPFDKETLAEMPVPIHRIPAKTLDATLQEYAGITTADLWDRSGVCYLPETDAYYNFTSDFGPGYFQADYGETTGESAWLWYGSDCLTLGRETDGWKIRSYQGPWEAMPYAKTISYYLEGQEQSETFTRYRGNGWYLYLPQGWEKDADADLWRYAANHDIRLEVRVVGASDLAEAQAKIRDAETIPLVEGKQGDLLGDDGKTVLHVRFYEGGYGTFAVLCRYPAEAAEGGGVRLQVIADTFRAKGAS